MPNLKSKIKDMKKDLILESASNMFEEYGFDDLKVTTLAKSVGVSVGTIYSYFESKEGLYAACTSMHIEEAYQMFKQLLDENLSFEETLVKSIRLKLQTISSKKCSIASGAMSNPFFFESMQIVHKEELTKIYKLFAPLVEKEKEVDIDTMTLLYLLNAFGNAYILRWIEGDLKTLDGVEHEIANSFIKIIKDKN